MDEPMTVEEMIYELAEIHVSKKKDQEREKNLCRALEDANVLVEDDCKGNGWRVIEEGGMPIIPSRVKHYVWYYKGYACVFWMGLGRPHGSYLICKSDPIAEEKDLNGGKPLDFSEVELEFDDSPVLRVVK